jgi:hypothetical protein
MIIRFSDAEVTAQGLTVRFLPGTASGMVHLRKTNEHANILSGRRP